MIKGPRMFVSNSFISQTGGHGDMRQRHERTGPRRYHPLMPQPAICDGEAEAPQGSQGPVAGGRRPIESNGRRWRGFSHQPS